MPPCIKRHRTALAIAQRRNLLRETRKAQTRVPCTVMAYHHRPVRRWCWGVVYAHIQRPRWHSNLRRLLEEPRC